MMSPSAKLTSIDTVEQMSAALAAFGEEVAVAIDQLDIETKRAMEWIKHDRKEYWTSQTRRNRDGISESRSELERAMTYRGVADQRPSCREERAELEKSKRRLRVSEEKIEAVRHWTHVIDHEILELVGGMSQLAQWLQADLPRAQGVLKRLAAALEGYVATPTTTLTEPPPAKASAGGRLTKKDVNDDEEQEREDGF
jgi:uncharacterized protein YdaT